MNEVHNKDIISFGQYVIFHRKDFKKLHLLSEKNKQIYMGKDQIELEQVVGKQINSTFKLVPKLGKSRHFTLQLCKSNEISSYKELLRDCGSGSDNRSICDDGLSQPLTSINIEKLRGSGTAPKVIMEQLLENSKTFQIKTEYSQEKYIKKKEKKYFEFISISWPSIRVLADIFYNRELPKSIGIRIDTLSQILTCLSMHPNGNYLLVESGFNGIVSATLLNALSEEGRIVQVTPNNQNQKQAVLAMNFSSSQLSQILTVRLSTALELIERNTQNINDQLDTSTNGTGMLNVSCENTEELQALKSETKVSSTSCEVKDNQEAGSSQLVIRKRKLSTSSLMCTDNSGELEPKIPRWAIEAEHALQIMLKKVDGLIVACKEYPVNIVCKLLEFVLPSRPFVIYSLYSEPLVNLYLQLKQQKYVLSLKLTETWLRPYQVLPDRSHPGVTVNSSSGFLLSGIKVL